MPEIAWRIQAPGPFCPCRCHIARRKLVICRQRVCQSILMITNGLTPVFGSKPLSWGTFGVLFDPPRFGLFILSLPLDDALETHACLLQNNFLDALLPTAQRASRCHSVPPGPFLSVLGS